MKPTELSLSFEPQEDGSWEGTAVIGDQKIVAAGESDYEVAFLLGAAAHNAGLLEMDDGLIELGPHLLDN